MNIRSGSTIRFSRSTFSYSGCFSITGSREENTSSTVCTNSGSLLCFFFTFSITLVRYAFMAFSSNQNFESRGHTGPFISPDRNGNASPLPRLSSYHL